MCITQLLLLRLHPGMPKYDAGERFDLRSPYADDGWVDPNEIGAYYGKCPDIQCSASLQRLRLCFDAAALISGTVNS